MLDDEEGFDDEADEDFLAFALKFVTGFFGAIAFDDK